MNTFFFSSPFWPEDARARTRGGWMNLIDAHTSQSEQLNESKWEKKWIEGVFNELKFFDSILKTNTFFFRDHHHHPLLLSISKNNIYSLRLPRSMQMTTMNVRSRWKSSLIHWRSHKRTNISGFFFRSLSGEFFFFFEERVIWFHQRHLVFRFRYHLPPVEDQWNEHKWTFSPLANYEDLFWHADENDTFIKREIPRLIGNIMSNRIDNLDEEWNTTTHGKDRPKWNTTPTSKDHKRQGNRTCRM